MVISGLASAQLAPGSPNDHVPPPWHQPRTLRDGGDSIELDPSLLVFDRKEIIDQPDRCAFRIIRGIYDAFDFGENDIPPEFDRKLGVLELP